ncbi:MAG: hypothetical protein R3314_12725 [Longimicrobiales bacterium]|nr:hypothetical protein [Longimicrobiales bacterium]
MGIRILVLLALGGLAAACAGRTVPDTLDPAVAERGIRETAPDRPLRAVFAWRVLDGQARFSGEGAARIEPPYRARLDLFGAHGETYLSAALVGDELRLPGDPGVALPPPAMMWAVLGVVRPPQGAELLGTRVQGSELELHYGVGDGRIRYDVADGRLRLADWWGDGRRMVAEVRGGELGLPTEAAFRDWSRNTELHLELERVEEVEPYPPEIWTPGR